jgi:signal transduction histidine kinase
MSRPGAGPFGVKRWLEAFLDQGVSAALSDPLKKRVRLTNAASLLGTIIIAFTIPFDMFEAPRWMAAQDLLTAIVFLGVSRLNRRGFHTTARLTIIGASTFLGLTQTAVLGRDSGADLIFLAMVAIPFVLFEVSERGPLALGLLLAIAGIVLTDTEMLPGLQNLPARYSARDYHLYSAALALAVVLSSLILMSQANARSERALRLDIEKRERTERMLAETRQASITSAKMAALGEMSANVAHEVNNPLAAILLRAQRLRLLAEKGRLDSAAVLKSAGEIDATVDRIRRIIDALRAFSRQADDEALRPERVSAIVSDTVSLCDQRFRHRGIELTVEPIADDLYVECRGVQISQVVLNLLSNAFDAVENGSVRRVRVAAEVSDGEVRIAVTDSGPGVAPEIEARIMEPFFTTKQMGRGTGLGLSVSKGIAEAHGGRLTHDLAAPETRFVLTLRRARPPV